MAFYREGRSDGKEALKRQKSNTISEFTFKGCVSYQGQIVSHPADSHIRMDDKDTCDMPPDGEMFSQMNRHRAAIVGDESKTLRFAPY